MRVHIDLATVLDQRGVAVLVLLDLSAAFDMVDHDILVGRMSSLLGVDSTALDWFKSYLTGRQQKVKIGEAWSLAKFLMYSVPQGSVLGPLLFLIYILPLHRLILSHGLGVHGYADDGQQYLHIKEPDNHQLVLSECVRIERCVLDVQQWMTANKLKLNGEKTEIMVFGTQQRISDAAITSLSIGGVSVSVSDKPIVNLGATLDCTLDMDAHISKTIRSGSFHLRNIGRVRNRLTTNATKQLVQSLVISRMDYCNSLLHGLSDTRLKRLQLFQNQAARLITRTKRTAHITPVMQSLHWLPVELRCKFKIACTVYKTLNGSGPKYLAELLVPYRPHRELRPSILSRADKLFVPKNNLAIGKRAFSVCAPTLWNSLPGFVKSADSFLSFKSSLKTYYFKQYYY